MTLARKGYLVLPVFLLANKHLKEIDEMRIFVTTFLLLLFTSSAVYAHGECCLSRSLVEATTSDVTTASNFGLSLQYEYTNMKTIRDGTKSISHNTVLDKVAEKWPEMSTEGNI